MKKSDRGKADEEAVKVMLAALEEHSRDGKVTSVRCDKCCELIQINAVGDTVLTSKCGCGRFNSIFKGL